MVFSMDMGAFQLVRLKESCFSARRIATHENCFNSVIYEVPFWLDCSSLCRQLIIRQLTMIWNRATVLFTTWEHLFTWHQPVTLLWAQLYEVPLLKALWGLHRHYSQHKAWWPELWRSRCGHTLLWGFNITSKSALITLHSCALIMHRKQEMSGGVSYLCITKIMFLL